MLACTKTDGMTIVPLSFPELMDGPSPQGFTLAVLKAQLKHPNVSMLTAIDCIDLVAGLLRALKIHHNLYHCSPRITSADLYYDVQTGAAAIHGCHLEPDFQGDFAALAAVLRDFFHFPKCGIILDEDAREGIVAMIREMRAARPMTPDDDRTEERFLAFREDWLRKKCGSPLGTVACLHLAEFMEASEPVKSVLMMALCAFNQVALIGEEKEDAGYFDAVCGRLQLAGLQVRREMICRSSDMAESVDDYRYHAGGHGQRFRYVTVSTIDRNEPRLPCLIVNPDLPSEKQNIHLYRRKVTLIADRRAPPIEQYKFNTIKTLLEKERERLALKYTFFQPVVAERVKRIDRLTHDMQEKDPGPAAMVWLDDALDELAGDMRPVGLHFFGRITGEKNIQTIRDKLWETSTLMWSSAHLGFRT